MQRLVHMSADLARQVGLMLEDIHNIAGEVTCYSLPLISLKIIFVLIFFFLAIYGLDQNFINMVM